MKPDTASLHPLHAQTRSASTAPGAIADPMLGEILSRGRSLAPESIERALEYQREQGVRFGEAVIRLGLADSDDVMWALSQQYHYAYAAHGDAGISDELVVARRPFDDSVEVFRDLRTQLILGGFGSAEDRTALAIVSTDRADGRSFVAANLAVAFGQLPGRTLLIDADLRTPRLHKVFDSPDSHGLASVLGARAELDIVRPFTEFPNLFLLPAGPKPPNPSELFQKQAFALLMADLTARFDYVIVDTPAAAQASDARVIAARCGAALVVSRRNHSRLPAIHQLATQLGKSRVKVAGMVINEP